MADRKICSVDGCGNPVNCKNFCGKHYYKYSRYGDPLGGYFVKVDSRKLIDEVVLKFVGDDCLKWPHSTDRRGYARAVIDGKYASVSRIVCERINGKAPTTSHQAAHNCGNGNLGCVNPTHLRWATNKENCSDRMIHGTEVNGEKCHMAKLTDLDIIEIRMMEGSMSQKAIGDIYGVTQGAISDIFRRATWKHIP